MYKYKCILTTVRKVEFRQLSMKNKKQENGLLRKDTQNKTQSDILLICVNEGSYSFIIRSFYLIKTIQRLVDLRFLLSK